MQPTLLDIAKKAQETFHRNMDTLVAGFLIRHPDIDPSDVELVFQPTRDGTVRFSIEPKELHVPPAKPETGESTDPVAFGGDPRDYARGWNDCRSAMIAQAKMVRAPEATVTKLEDGHGV